MTEEGAPIEIRKPLIHTIGDLYRLKREDLLGLERVGEKTADALLAQIERSKSAGWRGFCWGWGYGLSVRGRRSLLAEHFGSME